MQNFYRLNKDYIKTFQMRIMDRYRSRDKRTETSLFKALLEEINTLFRKIGGRISSKRNIPDGTDYPDSKNYNKLLHDIEFDIDKLFNSQKMIESDINNLINFNANQRVRTFESLTTAQQNVYSAYTKANRDTIGGITIPDGTPFASSDNMDSSSENVYIDQVRQVLTLAFDASENKDIDIKNTMIYFAGREPVKPIYPLGNTLGIGSHWKKSTNDPHFINTEDQNALDYYKTMMIDDPNNNIGVGFCEFEAVRTSAYASTTVTESSQTRTTLTKCGPIAVQLASRTKEENSSIYTLKDYIGQKYGKDSELIYIDLPNSLQGNYIQGSHPYNSRYSQTQGAPKYKLVIPFKTTLLTNEIAISFSANANGYVPKINWTDSKVYSKIGGGDVAYGLISPRIGQDTILDGSYIIHISSFIIPTRLELIIEYDDDYQMWIPFDFYMAYYVYSDQKTYELPYYGTQKVNITIKKSYDIFVDAEYNETKEKNRALNVLRSPNRSSI